MGFDEKDSPSPPVTAVDFDVAESQNYNKRTGWLTKIAAWGVEVRGITPVPLEERNDKRFINVFFVWFTMSTNLLPYVHLRPCCQRAGTRSNLLTSALTLTGLSQAYWAPWSLDST